MKTLLTLIIFCFSSTVFALNEYQPTPLTFQVIKTSINITKQDVRSLKVFQHPGFYSVDIVLKSVAAKRLSTITSSNINHTMQASIGDHIINQSRINSELGSSFELALKSKSAVKKLIRALS